MEDFMMKNLVLLNDAECSAIYGGRNQSLANLIEMGAMCIGRLARLLYLFAEKGMKHVGEQASYGYYYKF